jgi:hypothetical protein
MADQLIAEVLHDEQAACVCQPNETHRQLLTPTDLQIGE